MRSIISQPHLVLLAGLVLIVATWNSIQVPGNLADQLSNGINSALQQTSEKNSDHLKFKECLTPE